MTLYTQAYNGHAAGDYSIIVNTVTTESPGFTVNFTVTDSNGIVSPAESFTVNPVDLYITPASTLPLTRPLKHSPVASLASVTENAAPLPLRRYPM